MEITIKMELTTENLGKIKALITDGGATVQTELPTAPPPKEESTAQAVQSEETEAAHITKTDIRAVALKLSKAGKQDTLVEIFKKFGCKKLSDFDKRTEDYPALMRELVNANA